MQIKADELVHQPVILNTQMGALLVGYTSWENQLKDPRSREIERKTQGISLLGNGSKVQDFRWVVCFEAKKVKKSVDFLMKLIE